MRAAILSLAVLALAACGADDVTDSEEYEEMEAEQAGETNPDILTTEQTPGADPSGDELRADDMPNTGEEMTRWPVEPGNEEPGGKDGVLEKELEAMNGGEEPSTVTEYEYEDPPR